MNVLLLYTHFIFEHLCYNFFAIMNYAAMNNLVRVLVYVCVYVYFVYKENWWVIEYVLICSFMISAVSCLKTPTLRSGI